MPHNGIQFETTFVDLRYNHGYIIKDLGKHRTERNGSTGLDKLVRSVDPGLLQSLRKVLLEKEIDETGVTTSVVTDTGTPVGASEVTPPGSPTGTSTPAATPAKK